MKPRNSPSLEQLEPRVVPAVFGIPWSDASTLTVSFVADGTDVGNSPSNLFEKLGGLIPQAEIWQGEILRAIQTWINETNINVHLVDDYGIAFGEPGQIQGDFNFGDIRIGGASLGTNSVATAVPFDPITGTWSGDILLNTDLLFSIGGGEGTYDIYSVFLHETGHVFGLEGNLDNIDSAMFEYYAGVRSGLDTSDVVAIQNLYGVRKDDRFEGLDRNDTFETATRFMHAARREFRSALNRLETVDEAEAVQRLSINADLTSASDSDWYWYKATANNSGFELFLSAGDRSLIQARLTVYDQEGTELWQGSTVNGGAVWEYFNGLAPDRMYYFRVDALPGSDFAVGAYNLTLSADNAKVAARLDNIYDAFVAEATDNDSIATATRMVRSAQSTPARPTFFARGELSTYEDVDVYSINAPRNGALLRVTLSRPDGSIPATLTLQDDQGQVIPVTVVLDSTNSLVVEVQNLARGTYYLTVANSVNPSEDWVGAYTLAAQFKLPEGDPATPIFADVLAGDDAQHFYGVTLSTAQVINFEFAMNGTSGSAVEVAIYDDQETVLFTQFLDMSNTAQGSNVVQVQLLLGPGNYYFRFSGGTEDGSAFSNLEYSMTASVLNDPIGPQLIDPSAPPPPRDLVPLWTQTASVILTSLYDPYGRLYEWYERWY